MSQNGGERRKQNGSSASIFAYLVLPIKFIKISEAGGEVRHMGLMSGKSVIASKMCADVKFNRVVNFARQKRQNNY